MNNASDASFAVRGGAFLVDVLVIAGLQVVGASVLAAIITPFANRSEDPLYWLAPDATYGLVVGFFLLPIVYVAASWSRLFGHRSIGKRLFHLRVVRDRT